MKTQKLVAIMTLVTSATLLASCATSDLNVLTRKLDANNSTMETLDNAEEETDSFETESAVVHPLSLVQADDLTAGEKIDLVLSLRDSILAKQASLEETKTIVREDLVTLKAAIQQFKDMGLTLTDEEKILVSGYGDELDIIKVELKATVGLVYKELVELRGHYTLGNLDMILETYQTADDTMSVRVDGATRIAAIIDEVNTLLAVRIG